MAVVCVEQQCRRGQPWRRRKNSDDSPLPRLDWTDGEVEKVEKTTARLHRTRQCVFAVASMHDDSGAWLAMADCLSSLAARGGGEEMRTRAVSASGRRAGCSRRGWPCQGVHGAWPARSGERRRVAPRGVKTLSRSATATDRFLKTTRFSV